MAKKKPAKKPQDKPPEVERDEAGRIVSGTPNPGGQPRWVKDLRDALGEKCAPKAERIANEVLDRASDMKALTDVLEDEDAEPLARMGAERSIQGRYDQAIRVMAEVWKYTLPKPAQQVDVSGVPANPLAGLTPQQLLEFIKAK